MSNFLESIRQNSPLMTIVSIGLLVTTIVLSIILGEVNKLYPNISVWIILLCLVIITIVLYLIYSIFVSKTINKLENKIFDRFSKLSTSDLNSFSLTQNEFMDFEQSYQGSEIWVITSNLSNDNSKTGIYFDIVKENLNRGLVYRYFAPKNNLTRLRSKEIMESLKQFKDKIHWHLLDEDFFILHVTQHMGVYKPSPNTREDDLVYVEVKFDKTVRWLKLDQEMGIDLIAWLAQAIPEN